MFTLLLALFLTPVQNPGSTMICWDDVRLNRDAISWTAWECTADQTEKAVGPKDRYSFVYGDSKITVTPEKGISFTIEIPRWRGHSLEQELSQSLMIIEQSHEFLRRHRKRREDKNPDAFITL